MENLGKRDTTNKPKWEYIPFEVFYSLACYEKQFGDLRHSPVYNAYRTTTEFGVNPKNLLKETLKLKSDTLKTSENSLSDKLLGATAVFDFGSKKYTKNNWKRGLKYSVCLNSFFNHFRKLADGWNFDEESGLPHIDHMICNAIMLQWMFMHKPQLDDRWEKPKEVLLNLEDKGKDECGESEPKIKEAVNKKDDCFPLHDMIS